MLLERLEHLGPYGARGFQGRSRSSLWSNAARGGGYRGNGVQVRQTQGEADGREAVAPAPRGLAERGMAVEAIRSETEPAHELQMSFGHGHIACIPCESASGCEEWACHEDGITHFVMSRHRLPQISVSIEGMVGGTLGHGDVPRMHRAVGQSGEDEMARQYAPARLCTKSRFHAEHVGQYETLNVIAMCADPGQFTQLESTD